MNSKTKPAPPKIVIAPEGCHEYLTAGKEYNVLGMWDEWDLYLGYKFKIIDDNNENADCLENNCTHLNGGNWIIKKKDR